MHKKFDCYLIIKNNFKIKNIRYVEKKGTGLVMSCQSVLNIVYVFQQQKIYSHTFNYLINLACITI